MRKSILFVIIIALLAGALRLYRLSDVPPGVNRDEADIGFTAASLAATGRDEYGRFLPVSFESFGDWKLPLYIYTDIPFVKLFGENELAVRLPSAIAGIAGVVLLYFLVLALFESEALALVSAAVLAVMPWHLHISRVESESNIAIVFVLAGTLFFLSALRKKSLARLVASAVFLAATYYTYHGNHIFTSLYLLGVFAIYLRETVKIPRWWSAVAVGGAMTLIILSATLLGADRTKISGISIFGDPTVIHEKIELPRLMYPNPDAWYVRFIYNRITYAAETVFQNYLKSYGPQFLFISGGTNNAHNIRGFGNLHPLEAPLLLLGLTYLIANRRKKAARLILWWLAIAPMAAAITKDAPHSNRMFAVVPALAVTVASGIIWLTTDILAKRWRALAVGAIAASYLISMAFYVNQYYVRFPRYEAASWGYAYKRLVPVLFAPQYASRTVVMTRPETSPYIYILFYGGYDPALYQKQARRYPISPDGFTDVMSFGRFHFRAIDWKTDPYVPHMLLVAPPAEVPDTLREKTAATVILPDGTAAFAVLDTDK